MSVGRPVPDEPIDPELQDEIFSDLLLAVLCTIQEKGSITVMYNQNAGRRGNLKKTPIKGGFILTNEVPESEKN